MKVWIDLMYNPTLEFNWGQYLSSLKIKIRGSTSLNKLVLTSNDPILRFACEEGESSCTVLEPKGKGGNSMVLVEIEDEVADLSVVRLYKGLKQQEKTTHIYLKVISSGR